jgi:hypothetical protein
VSTPLLTVPDTGSTGSSESVLSPCPHTAVPVDGAALSLEDVAADESTPGNVWHSGRVSNGSMDR